MRIRQGQEISGSLKPPPVFRGCDEFLKNNIKDLECPVCGADSRNGALFYIFLDNANICIGINSVNGSEKDFVIPYQHFYSANISGIRCRVCGFNGDKEKFYPTILSGFFGKIVKIEDQWTTISSKNKRFCVLTKNVKRDVIEGNIVEILGILLEEIEDFEMIDLDDIIIRKRGNNDT